MPGGNARRVPLSPEANTLMGSFECLTLLLKRLSALLLVWHLIMPLLRNRLTHLFVGRGRKVTVTCGYYFL